MNTLSTRYASQEMSSLFSEQSKYSTWRKLWVALAEAESELGLPITREQIDEMKAHIDDINFDKVDDYEKELHHDVMAHIHAFGDQCLKAKSIIHLGATSCFVTDNTDVILMKKGMELLIEKLAKVLSQFADFSNRHKELPCLGFTHFQPAQLTTVGKRACLWSQDFLVDLQEMKRCPLRFLGVKGATGTQQAFLTLFNGEKTVEKLDQLVAEKMGFTDSLIISGQTYTRKQDVLILNTLAGLAISAHKFATDLRLLAHLKEIEEPFGKKQVGSSAMPYKRNPILSERICSLSRFLMASAQNPVYTAATQWLERSLDDSANRRLCIPDAFMTADAILELLLNLSKNLVVNKEKIQENLNQELPHLMTETILMLSVKRGGDRQKLHEKLRVYSQGSKENLLEEITKDSDFHLQDDDLQQVGSMRQLVGRAPEQVESFLKKELYPTIGRSS